MKAAETEAAAKPKRKQDKIKISDLSQAGKIAALLKKQFGPDFCDIVIDPDAPLQTAKSYIEMPNVWMELTGVPGVPVGHMTTIQGRQDSGKTTIAMHAMVSAQREGKVVVLIDTEFKFNKKRFVEMGGDIKELIISQAHCLEEVFDKYEKTVKFIHENIGNDVGILVVIDSLGLTPPREELEGDPYKSTVAVAARVIKKNVRRTLSMLHKGNVALLVVNHIYTNIKAMFGDATKGYGGDGIYFASVLVLEAKYIGKKHVQKNKKKVQKGIISQIECKKNHLSAEQGNKVKVLITPDGIDQTNEKPDVDGEEDDSTVVDKPVLNDEHFEDYDSI